jgi:hypothetical protein
MAVVAQALFLALALRVVRANDDWAKYWENLTTAAVAA